MKEENCGFIKRICEFSLFFSGNCNNNFPLIILEKEVTKTAIDENRLTKAFL